MLVKMVIMIQEQMLVVQPKLVRSAHILVINVQELLQIVQNVILLLVLLEEVAS